MNIEQEILNVEVSSQSQNKRKFDLEERLIDFAVLLIEISESLHNTPAGKHISGQIVRSGTSPALHYGEAQSAESRADFIHKLKILLKELRETFTGLKIIKRVPLSNKMEIIEKGLIECDELIAIFNKSIETAKRNNEKKK
ncbi:MAG: four helix bundle protein [Bacteroidia bacterium]